MADGEPRPIQEARAAQESARGAVETARRLRAALSEERARHAALEDVAQRRHGAVVPVSGDERVIARTRPLT